MAASAREPDVLTLDEAEDYLRVSPESLAEHAGQGDVPGQIIGGDWRFIRTALWDWLAAGSSSARLARLAGALADDETLEAITAEAYRRRGRPEVDPTPSH